MFYDYKKMPADYYTMYNNKKDLVTTRQDDIVEVQSTQGKDKVAPEEKNNEVVPELLMVSTVKNSDITTISNLYSKDVLKNAYNFTDEEIEKYFKFVDTRSGNINFQGWQLKQGLFVNGKEVNSLEELLDALGKGDPKKAAPRREKDSILRNVYQFTEEELNRYFDWVEDQFGEGWQLKRGLFVNGKEVNSLEELLDALGKGDPKKFCF